MNNYLKLNSQFVDSTFQEMSKDVVDSRQTQFVG